MNRRRFLALVGASTSAGCIGGAFPRKTDSPPCPSFPTARHQRDGQTICDGTEPDAPVYLEATRDAVSATDGTIDFAFVNGADAAISYGPCFWTLYEKTSDGWQTVRPVRGDAVAKMLPAHSSRELTLRVGPQNTTSADADCNPYSIAGLDTGRHLFGIQGHTPHGTTTLFLASFRAKE
jgi:hypothetical protein